MQLECKSGPTDRRRVERFVLVARGAADAQPVQPLMTRPIDEANDIGQVLQALSNGVRADFEIAKSARLTLDRVHIALVFLVANKCVVGSPDTRFRTTDSGNDMIKEANAVRRRLPALRRLCAIAAKETRQQTTLRTRKLPL